MSPCVTHRVEIIETDTFDREVVSTLSALKLFKVLLHLQSMPENRPWTPETAQGGPIASRLSGGMSDSSHFQIVQCPLLALLEFA